MSTSTGSARARPLAKRMLSPWTAAIIAGLALGGGIAAYVISNNNSSGGGSTPAAVGGVRVGVPQILSPAALRSFAAAASGPIYWVGPGHRTTHLEGTATSAGNVFVRYLTGSAVAGDPRPAFTTIGTYGLTDAFKVVKADGKAKGATKLHLPGGGIAESTAKAPDSYYVAFPGSNFVAEVYDPSPAYARQLVLSGKLVPIR